MSEKTRPARDGTNWSREELILAFDLYCRIPFSKTKANNPTVIALANLLQRTPASVARKLGNFGAFDPELQKKQISGLTHTSKLDKIIWNEFNLDWSGLVIEAARIHEQMSPHTPWSLPISEAVGPTEREVKGKQRIHQDFFRAAVLAGYNQQCCICGLPHPEILVASHIIPWSVRDDTRVNPENGFCLCASHDRAFDRNLLVIGVDFSVILCERLKQSKNPASQILFNTYEGKHISLPERFTPRREFLSWRFENFLSSQAK